jgi:TPR repeat protein
VSKELIKNKEFDKAIPLLRNCSELRNPECQYNFGVCLQYGYGIDKNDSLAFVFYLKAANQGWVDAQYKTSYSYAKGIGVEEDIDRALEYATRCANQNDIDCMSNLIGVYREGSKIKKDTVKMVFWLEKLALLEFPEDLGKRSKSTSARLNLAHIYNEGLEVEKNLFKAYVWYLIYNETKMDFSSSIREAQILRIRELHNILSVKEKKKGIKEARRLIGHRLDNLRTLEIIDNE